MHAQDTHSLRVMAPDKTHYQRVLDDTKGFLDTLDIKYKYITDPSPFPNGSPRWAKGFSAEMLMHCVRMCVCVCGGGGTAEKIPA